MRNSLSLKNKINFLPLCLLSVLLLAGISCKSPASPDETNALYDKYKPFEGTWEGQWTNNTYGTTGNATATVAVNTDGTVTVTIDLDGSVFGLIDPPPQTVTSTYDATGIVFEELGTAIGDIKVTMTPTSDTSGNIVVELKNTPLAGLDSIGATGTINVNTLHLDYTINFSDGSSATGVLDLTHVS